MPRNALGHLPFPPLQLIDSLEAFDVAKLHELASARPNGTSLCLRYSTGEPNRGGYFFHFKPVSDCDCSFMLYDFEGKQIHAFSASALVAFVNHCTGKAFDEPSFALCQNYINFTRDDEAAA